MTERDKPRQTANFSSQGHSAVVNESRRMLIEVCLQVGLQVLLIVEGRLTRLSEKLVKRLEGRNGSGWEDCRR